MVGQPTGRPFRSFKLFKEAYCWLNARNIVLYAHVICRFHYNTFHGKGIEINNDTEVISLMSRISWNANLLRRYILD